MRPDSTFFLGRDQGGTWKHPRVSSGRASPLLGFLRPGLERESGFLPHLWALPSPLPARDTQDRRARLSWRRPPRSAMLGGGLQATSGRTS